MLKKKSKQILSILLVSENLPSLNRYTLHLQVHGISVALSCVIATKIQSVALIMFTNELLA